jgi:uncharacterized LabA/DUF88 family protein
VGKNVAVFVDVANIFYAAKAAGVDIDYVTLLKSAIAGRDFVRAYAYTGLDPDNENQRNFHDFLRRVGYKVVSKDIRKYGDGKVKANLDIELVVDMLKTARNLDVAIVVSGDGDFAPAIRAIQEMGVRCEVISFRGNTSSDLMDVADQFTDIIQIAKVEKGTSRSGRRVAGDEQDLSMTEVPDKMTEGTGRGRGIGRGRGRGRIGEAEREPVAAAAARTPSRGGRPRRVEAEPELAVAAAGAPVIGLVALPGEKLSKAAQARIEAAAAVAAAPIEPEVVSVEVGEGPEGGPEGEEAGRRRRRRGGRGRGRGRGRDEAGMLEEGAPEGAVVAADQLERGFEAEEEREIVASTPRGPKPAAFGSFWDSQIGQTRAPAGDIQPFVGEEDEEEPAIPEYLIAEQRRGAAGARGGPAGRGGGARGGRAGAYASAVERERYGRGGGGGGINRYPDVSGRPSAGGGGGAVRSGQAPRRDDRRPDRVPLSDRPAERPSAERPSAERPSAGRSTEPWSEVPPELEAMLRAQLASKSDGRPSEPRPVSRVQSPAAAPAAEAAAPKRRASARTKAAAPAAEVVPTAAAAPAAEAAAPKRRAPARTKAAAPAAEAAAPKRRAPARTKAAAPAAEVVPTAAAAPAAEAAAPKRRPATRKRVEPAEA